MADNRKQLRRKHSSVDLQQVVTQIDVYNRPLNSTGGKSGAVCMLVHEGVVATTDRGKLYLIEKDKSQDNDDINYQIRYREGERRIVQVTQKEIRDWKLVRSVKKVKSGLILEDLFDACGEDYSWYADNCWNATHRMRAAANEAEDGMRWQWKFLIGLLVKVAAVAAVWMGPRMIRGRLGEGNKVIARKKAQKH